MPQTPALDSSSVTPVTPGSQFPVTPTTGGTSYEGFGPKDDRLFYKAANDREVDPTTLFVGGLEMSGPSAWDEDRVKSFFSRFGGLESVKVVRPGKELFSGCTWPHILTISTQPMRLLPLRLSNSTTLRAPLVLCLRRYVV